jgi:hypothetical protein
MKRISLSVWVVAILALTLIGVPHSSVAEVNVSIGINFGPPPPVVIAEPPPVVVVPGTYVYFVPTVEVGIFFYHGYWYRPYEGRWYRAGGYNGPWVYTEPAHVPVALVHLPPDYRHVPPGHQRIPYGQLQKNWRTWEKERRWDKHEARVQHTGSTGHPDPRGPTGHAAGKGKGKH